MSLSSNDVGSLVCMKSFYITRHGKRVAELGPVLVSQKRRVPGFAKGAFPYMAHDFDAPIADFREYER